MLQVISQIWHIEIHPFFTVCHLVTILLSGKFKEIPIFIFGDNRLRSNIVPISQGAKLSGSGIPKLKVRPCTTQFYNYILSFYFLLKTLKLLSKY